MRWLPSTPTAPPPPPQDKVDALAAKHPDRLSVYYVVDKANWGGAMWKGGVGYISKDMVRDANVLCVGGEGEGTGGGESKRQ